MKQRWMLRLRLWAAAWGAGQVGLAGSAMAASSDDSFAALSEYIEQARQDWKVPGVAVGVIRDGEVVYVRGFGAREVGKEPRVDAHTLFQIGSLTKAFTATALGLLVDEGKLSWDDPVVKHVPSFRVADPWLTQNITVRDVVGHRTGLEGGTHTIVPTDSARLLHDTSRLTSRVPFRDAVLYSNTMYDVAGQVVAAVAGMSWDEFVRRRLFVPLQMSESSPDVVAAGIWPRERLAPTMYGRAPAGRASLDDVPKANVAMPHWLTEQGSRALPWQILLTNGGGASGSIVSNLQDLLQWTRFNLGEGRDASGSALIRAATLREVQTPQLFIRDAPSASFEIQWSAVERLDPEAARRAYPPAYALGWFVNSYRGYRYVDHGGALLGGTSSIAFMPERRMAVVVLANSYGYGGRGMLNDAITLRAFDQMLGVESHDWSADFLRTMQAGERERQAADQQLQRSRLKNAPHSLPLSAYVGEYENDAFGKIRVEQTGKELTLQLPGVFSWRLQHWHHDTFRLQVGNDGLELMQFFLNFQVDARGRVSSFDPGWVLLGGAFKPVAK
ncbi:serine hydrolase [Steroidobacter sp.]|uniref:serine hydrolase n=1 Tax=Steroidobacter sp. TaxID=1978227 RepID=UPI001A39B1E8|nr:serine hydrolase [Steroidobacter sp.]MBL8271157.1 serine hydrolase [Steroidobacter sp.]